MTNVDISRTPAMAFQCIVSLVTALAASGLNAPYAHAGVDLVWSPDVQTVLDESSVFVSLIARTDSATPMEIAAIDAVITWDVSALQLIGVIDEGPYPWLQSGFLPDAASGLNESLDDGDAKYTALANFDTFPLVTQEGLLVTTFQFIATQLTQGADVSVEEMYGPMAVTIVFGADVPGQIVTGALGDAIVRVAEPGDCDANMRLDMDDLARLQVCHTGAVGPVDPPAYSPGVDGCCAVFDADADGDIDLDDVASFQMSFTGP